MVLVKDLNTDLSSTKLCFYLQSEIIVCLMQHSQLRIRKFTLPSYVQLSEQNPVILMASFLCFCLRLCCL